ncbi:MAG: PLP-dependent aminotransferase family protein [Clostridiales bacterium]|nr:PLP-dependent aminotransferase family protein [Clostridiales bacterium]
MVEDCPYRELRYEGEVQPSLRSFDTEGRVIHLGSFSKVLCPGLRIGYVIADVAIIQKLLMLHSVGDLQCTTVVMYALDRLLEQFDLDAHVRHMCGVYAEKKNRMIALLGEQLPPGATYTNPEGGLFLWLTLPGGIDMGALMREVLVPRAKVLLLPGEALFCENPQRNTARLNFSHPSLEKIEQGIASMGRVLREVIG